MVFIKIWLIQDDHGTSLVFRVF